MKYKFTSNLGSEDALAVGLDFKECTQGSVVDVPDEAAKSLLEKYPALLEEPEKSLKAIAKEPAVVGVPEESPVHDEGAREAIDEISRMTSKPKLQHIIDNDKRKTVVAAAKERLASL